MALADRHFEMIQTNGVRLRTVVEGEGPLVILLHGFPQCWYLWRHQIDPLVAAGFRVAVPDQRGYGGSECPPEVADYGIRDLSADVDGIATALGHDHYALLIHDWGCIVGYHTALPLGVPIAVGCSTQSGKLASHAKLRLPPDGYERLGEDDAPSHSVPGLSADGPPGHGSGRLGSDRDAGLVLPAAARLALLRLASRDEKQAVQVLRQWCPDARIALVRGEPIGRRGFPVRD